jgi:hypothetical protein
MLDTLISGKRALDMIIYFFYILKYRQILFASIDQNFHKNEKVRQELIKIK